jgi:hypothetical protein
MVSITIHVVAIIIIIITLIARSRGMPGRVEFRVKLPRGDFLWPALWLLPEDEASLSQHAHPCDFGEKGSDRMGGVCV